MKNALGNVFKSRFSLTDRVLNCFSVLTGNIKNTYFYDLYFISAAAFYVFRVCFLACPRSINIFYYNNYM